MPSTVVHVAFGGLIAVGLLGSAFDRRSLLVVCVLVAFPDLDTVVGLFLEGTHRAAFHTLLIPLGAAVVVYVDTRIRDRSVLRSRYDDWGVRVAWVSIVAYAVAAIGLDLFNRLGANVFYPLHDQFYTVTGHLKYGIGDGWQQSFVQLEPTEASGDVQPDPVRRGSTDQVHVPSGVDPQRGPEKSGVERHFPVAVAGWQLFVIVTSVVVLTAKRRLPDAESDAVGE